MSTENRLLDLPYVAAEDLSSYQYHFVVLNSSGQVRLPDSANEVAFGILQNAPASGEIAAVRVAGVSKFKGNAAIDIGKFIRPEYVGPLTLARARMQARTGCLHADMSWRIRTLRMISDRACLLTLRRLLLAGTLRYRLPRG